MLLLQLFFSFFIISLFIIFSLIIFVIISLFTQSCFLAAKRLSFVFRVLIWVMKRVSLGKDDKHSHIHVVSVVLVLGLTFN